MMEEAVLLRVPADIALKLRDLIKRENEREGGGAVASGVSIQFESDRSVSFVIGGHSYSRNAR